MKPARLKIVTAIRRKKHGEDGIVMSGFDRDADAAARVK
jgi:hypothetical protein